MAEMCTKCSAPAALAATATRPAPRAVHRIEGLAPGLEENADEVNDGVRAGHGRRDRVVVAQVGLDADDLTDVAHGTKVSRRLRVAHRNADARAAVR